MVYPILLMSISASLYFIVSFCSFLDKLSTVYCLPVVCGTILASSVKVIFSCSRSVFIVVTQNGIVPAGADVSEENSDCKSGGVGLHCAAKVISSGSMDY